MQDEDEERGRFWWCFGRNHVPMTPYESLRLSPFQKWRRYGRFPWKLLINVLLLILTTVQVIVLNGYIAPYARSQLITWRSLLMNTVSPVAYLYTIDTLQFSITNLRDTFYNIQNSTIDYYEYMDDQKNLVLHVESYVLENGSFQPGSDNFNSSTVTNEYELSSTSLGPFDGTQEDITTLAHSLVQIKALFSLGNYDSRFGSQYCYKWNIMLHYDFTERGRIAQSVHPSSSICSHEKHESWFHRQAAIEIVLFFVTLCFAIVSQILHVKAIAKSVKMYSETKQKYRGYVEFNDLPFSSRIKFFNLWFFVASIGNFCNIIGPFIGIKSAVNGDDSSVTRLALTGLGCMMSWINIVQYFEHSNSYYVLILTLKRGTPRVLRFLVGVLPVFLGYAFFGVANFSAFSEYFADLDSSCVTLFSLLNGDVVHDVFDELYPYQPLISRLYLYTFISLFIYAVLNIFIAIVEDAFFASKIYSMNTHYESADNSDILEFIDGPPINTPVIGRRSADHALEPLIVKDLPRSILTRKQNHLHDIIFEQFDRDLKRLRKEFNEHMKGKVMKMRPPHDMKYYPCQFEDCVYCKLKGICEDAVQSLETKLDAVLLTQGDIKSE